MPVVFSQHVSIKKAYKVNRLESLFGVVGLSNKEAIYYIVVCCCGTISITALGVWHEFNQPGKKLEIFFRSVSHCANSIPFSLALAILLEFLGGLAGTVWNAIMDVSKRIKTVRSRPKN